MIDREMTIDEIDNTLDMLIEHIKQMESLMRSLRELQDSLVGDNSNRGETWAATKGRNHRAPGDESQGPASRKGTA